MSEFKLAEATAVLSRTPSVCAALLDGLPDTWSEARERPDAWSCREIVAHLIEGERSDWIPRARTIIAHGEAVPFTPFDRSTHLEEAAREPLSNLLGLFDDLRIDNLQTLHAMKITPELLQRTGMHPDLGSVTLENLLATWVVHDMAHIKQMTRALATRYREAVGPWNHANYLRILQDT